MNDKIIHINMLLLNLGDFKSQIYSFKHVLFCNLLVIQVLYNLLNNVPNASLC